MHADAFLQQEAGRIALKTVGTAQDWGGRVRQGRGPQRGKAGGGGQVYEVDIWGEKLGDVWAMQDCLSQVC